MPSKRPFARPSCCSPKTSGSPKSRLDQYKLDDLAERERRLADETAKTGNDKLGELQLKQKQLEDELAKLQQDSEPLREALQSLREQQFKRTAREAERLEQELRELTQAMKDAELRSREIRMASLIQRQQDVAKRGRELAAKTSGASRTGPLPPLKSEEIDKAVDALKNGNLADAVNQQQRAVLELDRLAEALKQAVAQARDPRMAVLQLERLQTDLRQRLSETLKEAPIDRLAKERREAFEKQQQAIQKAAAKLSVPANAADAQAARKNAVDNAGQAHQALGKADANAADDRMEKTPRCAGQTRRTAARPRGASEAGPHRSRQAAEGTGRHRRIGRAGR